MVPVNADICRGPETAKPLENDISLGKKQFVPYQYLVSVYLGGYSFTGDLFH